MSTEDDERRERREELTRNEPRSRGVSASQLIDTLAMAARLWPNALLVKNRVGNLAVLHRGEYVGYIDLAEATLERVDP